MSRKYPSMQDELQARKAAGEYGDLSEYNRRLYRNEPEWAKKSREDYERSRKINNGGAGRSRWLRPATQSKWSLRDDEAVEQRAKTEWSMRDKDAAGWTKAPSYGGAAEQKSSAGRQKSSVRKQKTPKLPRQKTPRPRPSVQNPRKGKAGCLIAVALLFVVFPIVGAIISIFGDIVQDFGDTYTYEYDYADDWESGDGELDEYSTYTEAENYIFEQVAGGEADSEALNNLVFDAELYDYLPDTASISTTDGYVVIWTECDSDDDPGEVLADLAYITEQYRSALDDNGYDDVPVVIIMKETEAWELRLVMADGTIYYASGDYADFVE